MWNFEFEGAKRITRLISIPRNAKDGPVFIEVPEGTTFRSDIRWDQDRPVIIASTPAEGRNMIKLRLCVYRVSEVPMDRDICGPFCLGTFYLELGKMDLHVAFLDANAVE